MTHVLEKSANSVREPCVIVYDEDFQRLDSASAQLGCQSSQRDRALLSPSFEGESPACAGPRVDDDKVLAGSQGEFE